MNRSRRTLLGTSAGFVVASFFGKVPSAFATMEDVEKAIAEFSGGTTPTEGGVLSLTTPEIAENGNSVPVSVNVDSPMTEDAYVESVLILAEGNPNPEVIQFNFSPASGSAKASTRIRLAKTQNVVAIAKLSDGSLHSMKNTVKVTIGGCGG